MSSSQSFLNWFVILYYNSFLEFALTMIRGPGNYPHRSPICDHDLRLKSLLRHEMITQLSLQSLRTYSHLDWFFFQSAIHPHSIRICFAFTIYVQFRSGLKFPKIDTEVYHMTHDHRNAYDQNADQLRVPDKNTIYVSTPLNSQGRGASLSNLIK